MLYVFLGLMTFAAPLLGAGAEAVEKSGSNLILLIPLVFVFISLITVFHMSGKTKKQRGIRLVLLFVFISSLWVIMLYPMFRDYL